mmetsp:Transcript_21543/g.19110  ORF Transcript_21543/g.19110 Transcript_21543/m.19110 type:complete len:87 (+) Transcript_21543:189-449(+)
MTELKVQDLFEEVHYDYLVKNRYLILYCKLNIKLEVAQNYQCCLKLIDHVEDIGKELNEEFKQDIKEELRDQIDYKHFKVNFYNVV